MSKSLTAEGFVVPFVLTTSLFAAGLFLAISQAAADTCNLTADQLAHQNTPLQDAAQRLTTCAKKHAKYDDSLASRTKSEWQGLCEKNGEAAYRQLAANRETILRRCRPRGSGD